MVGSMCWRNSRCPSYSSFAIPSAHHSVWASSPSRPDRLDLTGPPKCAKTLRWSDDLPLIPHAVRAGNGIKKFAGPGMGSFMAMQPAHSAPPGDLYGGMPGPQYYPPSPRRQRIVWPWPVFLLGLAALAVVWIGRPYWRPTDGDRAQRDLAEMRNLVNRNSPDLTRAMAIGRKLLDLESKFPQYAGEAHFLMGCAHSRKAEDSAEPDAEW